MRSLASLGRPHDYSRDHASTCWNSTVDADIDTLWVHMSSRHHAPLVSGWAELEAGGASRDRTGDLLVANQALSQLSYGPVR